MSSAYKVIENDWGREIEEILFMYRMKNSGRKMDPCGTPEITSDLGENNYLKALKVWKNFELKKAQLSVKTQEFNKNLLYTAYDIFQLFKVRRFAKILLWKVMTFFLSFGSYLCRYIDQELKILAP